MGLLLVAGLVGLAALPGLLAAKDQRACQDNLRRIGVALSMYAAESAGERYPAVKTRDCLDAVQPWSGAIDLEGVVPAYLESADVLVCPSYKAGNTAVSLWDGGQTTNSRWAFAEGFSSNGIVEPCEVLGKPYYY